MRSCALLLAWLAGFAGSASAVIIDRIAATIDQEVITLSEVNRVIEVRLITRNAGETEETYRRRVLDSLIAQALRYRDVVRFGADDVSKDAIAARLLEVERRFASGGELEQALRRAELTPDELEALVKRQLQVEAYITERFSSMIFVSIEEIETYYTGVWRAQRRERGLPDQPLAQVREEIRGLLKSERLEAEIQVWTQQLRTRANVDIYIYR